ncbi:protein rolling stone-like [Ylistrum balloti]|uniref:protein rolling stone-like n=1 Tax=Ylistrum balloti TaxID=509963 RepID=UPI002905C0DB|nr:protein rolling stone-like [Ylistrum balloti]XP_060073940.1 protein rolling stone-like [Ylistrum balloti]
MFKITAKFVDATNGGMRMAHRALTTYTRYAYYSLTDKKGRPSGKSGIRSSELYEPRYGLDHACPEDFVLSQWSDNPVPYAIYRTIVAFYFSIMVFYTAFGGNLGWKIFIMLTYWSFYILTFCQILRAVNVWHYIALKKEKKDINAELKNAPRIKLQWLLHIISAGSAQIVTILFWTIAYDGSGYTFINLNSHGVNAVFVLIDTLVTRTPTRLLQCIYTSAFGCIYSLFTFVYFLAGGTSHHGNPYIYKPLNYGEKPGTALAYIVVIASLVAPLLHSMVFFLYRFRVFIHRFLRTMDKRQSMSN